MNSKVKTIWMVDDDADDREIFQEIIENLDCEYNFHGFNNGSSAIARLDDEVPDILFLDLNMPPLDGYQTLEKIREHTKFNEIPRIIIFTTSISDFDQNQTFEMGASMFLTKFADYNKVRETLKQILDIDWESREITRETFIYKPLNK